MRVSKNHKISSITALAHNQVNPEDTETYRHYKEAFDSIHQSITTQNTRIRSSLADIENQKVQTLDALKKEHGFTTKTQQDGLVRSIVNEFKMLSSEIEPLVKKFAAGDSRPLAKKLCAIQKKATLESVIGQLRKNTPGPNWQDYYHALTENQTTGDKTVARRVFAEQTRATLFGYELLQRSYKRLAFAESEEPEEDNQGVCYWVPASIKHEEKVSTNGLSRYSFFVYGGVRIQPRTNIVQGSGATLSGRHVSDVALSNINAQAAMNDKMRALQKAQKIAVRTETLLDGRIRYYEAERPNKTPGPTRGASIVTEYNPKTGQYNVYKGNVW